MLLKLRHYFYVLNNFDNFDYAIIFYNIEPLGAPRFAQNIYRDCSVLEVTAVVILYISSSSADVN